MVKRPIWITFIASFIVAMCVVGCTYGNNNENSDNNKDVISHVVAKTDLDGYWHSAPDFSQGEQETYEFYEGEGACFHKDAGISRDGNRYEGTYTLENNILEVAFSNEKGTYKCDVEYVENDAVTDGQVLIINGQKFWKMDRPDDFIDGSPLYINRFGYVEKYKNREAVVEERLGQEPQQRFIIYCDTVLNNVKISRISPADDFKYGIKFYFEDVIYSLDVLSPDQYLEYIGILDIGSMPTHAISFSGQDGEIHSYAIIHQGRVLPITVAKYEILEKA